MTRNFEARLKKLQATKLTVPTWTKKYQAVEARVHARVVQGMFGGFPEVPYGELLAAQPDDLSPGVDQWSLADWFRWGLRPPPDRLPSLPDDTPEQQAKDREFMDAFAEPLDAGEAEKTRAYLTRLLAPPPPVDTGGAVACPETTAWLARV